MSDSRIPAAIDKLVEVWTTGVSASIIDGPLVTGAEPIRRLYVGYNGDPESERLPGATGDQSWVGTVGAKRRDETFTIPCAVVVHQGGQTIKAARDAAFAVLAEAANVLRDNVTLGFPPPSNAQLGSPSMAYVLTDTTGLEVHIAFDVEVSTRI